MNVNWKDKAKQRLMAILRPWGPVVREVIANPWAKWYVIAIVLWVIVKWVNN